MTQNPLKHCGGCNKDLPRTSDFFYMKRNADRFVPSSRCKPCSIRRSLERYHTVEGVNVRMRAQSRAWARENAAKVREQGRLYRQENAEAIRAKLAAKKASPAGRLKLNQRSRLNKLRHKYGVPAEVTTDSSIGCTWDEFAAFLERQFTDGMSWTNYGSWHIDHIVPISSVDLTDAEQASAVLNFKNTRPLWGHENHKKGARVLKEPT